MGMILGIKDLDDDLKQVEELKIAAKSIARKVKGRELSEEENAFIDAKSEQLAVDLVNAEEKDK